MNLYMWDMWENMWGRERGLAEESLLDMHCIATERADQS